MIFWAHQYALFFSLFTDSIVDWVSVPALGTMMKVVCMASNKVFSGPSICENEFLPIFITVFVLNNVIGKAGTRNIWI